MGMYDDASSYIQNITMVQRENISKVMNAVSEPAVAALLIGKIARASELNVNFVLREGCYYSAADMNLPSEMLITVIGNLLDNAFEGETILQFDLKMDNTAGYLIIQIYRGGERGRYGATFESDGVRATGGSSGTVHEPGVWYTYIYHMKADTMDIYRKERDSAEPFKQVLAGVERTTNTSPAQLQPYCAKGMDASMDNIKIHTGTFAGNAAFEINGKIFKGAKTFLQKSIDKKFVK